MRKAILVMAVLAVTSGSAMAEWVQLAVSDDGKQTIYADPAIRKAGNRVKMWVMTDFNMPQKAANGRLYLSDNSQMGYDCNEELGRYTFFSWHAGHMGAGEIVTTKNLPNNEWVPVPPKSLLDREMKFACGKR